MTIPPERPILQELKTQAWILGGLVALMWGIQLLNTTLLGGRLTYLGIHPRDVGGLRGIVFAPFLHGNFNHLIANTIPFITLGWLIMLQRTRDFLIVTAIAMVVSGLGTWMIGAPNSIHIGASGVIFGYFGYLLMRGYFERSLPAIALSLLVISFYGSLIWGVLPQQRGVSWEGHLFGFVGGAVAARLLARPRVKPID
jgi:membrane associated rhomboid family serine protease